MSNLKELNYAIISELRDQLEAKEQMIKKLKGLLAECRQKMFEAEKNYGFDDSIIDIYAAHMDDSFILHDTMQFRF